MPDHVFAAYSMIPDPDDPDMVILKTAHVDKNTGEMVVDSCVLDIEKGKPLTEAMPGQVSVMGSDFNVKRGQRSEAFEKAMKEFDSNEIDPTTGDVIFKDENGQDVRVNQELYATMTVLEDDMGMTNAPDVVQAVEKRLEGLEHQSQRAELCEAPSNLGHDQVAATIITADNIHVLTKDGHMFDATEQALGDTVAKRDDLSYVSDMSLHDRGQAKHEYAAQFSREGAAVFHSPASGRNLAGAAMEIQSDPKTAGGSFDTRLHIEDSKEPLTHDLGMNFEMSDER